MGPTLQGGRVVLAGSRLVLVKQVGKRIVMFPALRAKGKTTLDIVEALFTGENEGCGLRSDPKAFRPSRPLDRKSLRPQRHLQRFNSPLHPPAGSETQPMFWVQGLLFQGQQRGKGLGNSFSSPAPCSLCLCHPCQRKAFGAS